MSAKPQWRVQAGAGAVPATGPVIVGLGGPSAGVKWDVRRLVAVAPALLASGPSTAVAVVVITGPTSTTLNPLAIADALTPNTVPASANYGESELEVLAGDHLEVWIYGLAATTTVVCIARCIELPT